MHSFRSSGRNSPGGTLMAAAPLHGFDQNRPDMFADEKSGGWPIPRWASRPVFFGKRHKVSKFAKLKIKRVAEEVAVSGVERAVAEAVIRAFEGNHPAPAGGQHRGLERGFNGLKNRNCQK